MAALQSPHKPAWLLLEDGTYFTGKSLGASGTSGGELCFNTGMTGYQEVFTDPSYFGQVLIMNTAYVGNYGVKKEDVESGGIKIKALVCKNISNRYSRMMADASLEEYLIQNGIVAIYDVDTRALVQHIRSKGAMNAIVTTELMEKTDLKKELDKVPNMRGLDLTKEVTTKEPYFFGNENAKYRISVLDFGVKQSMLHLLSSHDAYLKVFPGTSSATEIFAFKPDGIFISNGPGDPGSMDYAVSTIKEILASEKPLFGICLGHQLLARAYDVPTFKMHHGHRGLNHPVKNLITGKSEITTQNHGFGVDEKAAQQSQEIEVTHINLNDGSIEGLRVKNKPAFSVQYHPESTPGPHDSRYLFNNFIQLIEQNK
ncbi:MAG: glutamine-hydrolyzing carbamoyl-phosphate synthase small subunit [Bacteroidetes bacterium]|nr:glutamine-hydrolyzing carbamoyl-phosphate synthase small subunit [Bacteroidota bacterium]MBS1739731.1 glutamine-hydrolyzing carbamoyl-phosphate synthase small subunit [Bacteroidota bacterium]MBS1776688.1 glutamine-hydrolyzing carbamoyl-phosphate synthase small subunit [Bacteroidota bacterium]